MLRWRIETREWLLPLVAVFCWQVGSSVTIRGMPTLAPLMAERVGWLPAQLGYVASLLTVGTALFLLLGMPLIRRAGPLRSLQLGLLVMAMGCALTAVPHAAALVLGSLLIGIGSGPGSSASNVVVGRYAPPAHQGLAFSLKQNGVPMGSVLAGLVLPAVALNFGLEAAILGTAAVCVLVVWGMQQVRGQIDQERKREQPLHLGVWFSPENLANLKLAWRDPKLRRAGLAGACLGVGQGTWFTYLVTYLVTEQGYTLLAAGALFALMQMASLAGRPLLGLVSDRTGSAPLVLALAGVGSALCTAALAMMTPQWPAWAASALAIAAGCSVSAWNGVQIMQSTRLAAPDRVAESTGAIALMAFVGFAMAPLLMALGHAVMGHLKGAWCLAAVVTLGVVPLQRKMKT